MKTTPRIKIFKNGASAYFGRCGIGYETFARNPTGEIVEKMRCDDYRLAMSFYKSFQAVARNS